MNPSEYLDSIAVLSRPLYVSGDCVPDATADPRLRPGLNALAMTYDSDQVRAQGGSEDLMFVRSPLTGKLVNRFTHIHESVEDLVKKVKLQRLLGQMTGVCFQRCVGWDGINALWSTTYEVDQAFSTDYHQRLKRYVAYVQEHDLVVDGAMTDVKGDRSLSPSMQPDPDAYVHIVERRTDGIVIRGAKAHQTGACGSHEVLVLPTVRMRPEDVDYAVSCAMPADSPGILMICGRQPSDDRRAAGDSIDVGNARFCGHESLIVFEDVFVPWERVFLAGEVEFTGRLVERFAAYHRQSYGGCKSGVGDVLIGAAALATELNGIGGASHIRDKLVEMTHLNETLYSCGVACSALGHVTESGNYEPDILLSNVTKQNVTRFPYEIARLAEDLAGGLVVTTPSELDFGHETVGPLLEKYFRGSQDCSTEDRVRAVRLIEFLTTGPGGASYRTESLHGAGSPQTQRVMIWRGAGLEHKKNLAKSLAGIDTEALGPECVTEP